MSSNLKTTKKTITLYSVNLPLLTPTDLEFISPYIKSLKKFLLIKIPSNISKTNLLHSSFSLWNYIKLLKCSS